ncbi:MAG: lipid-A-disaccharide synthase [Armatimonadetes bacterium]|nr:lipid-A-disaccharide synthase [Armatimonadota bacterium]
MVCGEPSGDIHAAELVREARQLIDIEVVAAGGPALRDAGADVRWTSVDWGAIGPTQALAKLPLYWHVMRELLQEAITGNYDLVVLVDFGAFNTRLAERIRRRAPGLRIFYYFPPSSWARAKRRWDRLLSLTDYIATPFSWNAAALAAQGASVRWVGHPAVDRITSVPREEARAALQLNEGDRALALLPGSRRLERRLLGGVFVQAAKLAKQRLEDLVVLWSPPPGGQDAPELQAHLRELKAVEIRDTAVLLRAADTALACFGTVTLEAALAGCPLVAAYRGTLAMRVVFRFMHVDTRYYAMPNIVLQQAVVPELIGSGATPERLASECVKLLTDEAARQTMLAGYAEVRRALGPPGASRRAAEMLVEALEGTLRPHRPWVDAS